MTYMNTASMIAAIDGMKSRFTDLYRCDVMLTLPESFIETFSPSDSFEVPYTIDRLTNIQATYKAKYARDIIGDIIQKLRILCYLNNDLQVMNSMYETWYMIQTEIACIESRIAHSSENNNKDMTLLRAFLQCRYQIDLITWGHGYSSALQAHLSTWNLCDEHDICDSLKLGFYGDYERHTMLLTKNAMSILDRIDAFKDLNGTQAIREYNDSFSLLPKLSQLVTEMCGYICYAKDTVKYLQKNHVYDEIDAKRSDTLETVARDMQHVLDLFLSIKTIRG